MNDSRRIANSNGTQNDIHLFIKNIIASEDFIHYDILKKPISTGGGNFLGILTELDIKGETSNGEKVIHLFIKEAVKLNKISIISVDDVFSKEAFVYNELSKVFHDVQTKFNVPYKEMFKVGKSYKAGQDTLILENLCFKGFKTYHRMEVPQYKYMKLGIEVLARFHGLSFVLQHLMPKYYDTYIKSIKQPYMFNDDWRQFAKNISLYTVKVLPPHLSKKLEGRENEFTEKYKNYYKNSENIKNCLCHGDYKINNVLVKEHEGTACEVLPIDYQLIHFGNPLKDFFHFIYSSTDRDFRCKNLQHLKEVYYETLVNFLHYFNIDVERTFSRKDFELLYSEALEYGLIMGIYGTFFAFVREDGFDSENLSMSELPVRTYDGYAERVAGILEDYIQLGFL